MFSIDNYKNHQDEIVSAIVYDPREWENRGGYASFIKKYEDMQNEYCRVRILDRTPDMELNGEKVSNDKWCKHILGLKELPKGTRGIILCMRYL